MIRAASEIADEPTDQTSNPLGLGIELLEIGIRDVAKVERDV
jgi:hypothetical protein